MKLSFYTYTLLFFAVLLGAVQSGYGQVVPYTSVESVYRLYPNNNPLYSVYAYNLNNSILNYYDVLESKLVNEFLNGFNYYPYKYFTASKGVDKITFYDYQIASHPDSISKKLRMTFSHTFIFDKQTNLLVKEILHIYDKSMLHIYKVLGSGEAAYTEYVYQYEESFDQNHSIVKKMFKNKDSLMLVNKYVYSKDKSKLLHVISKDVGNYLIGDYKFSYDKEGNISKIIDKRDDYNFNLETMLSPFNGNGYNFHNVEEYKDAAAWLVGNPYQILETFQAPWEEVISDTTQTKQEYYRFKIQLPEDNSRVRSSKELEMINSENLIHSSLRRSKVEYSQFPYTEVLLKESFYLYDNNQKIYWAYFSNSFTVRFGRFGDYKEKLIIILSKGKQKNTYLIKQFATDNTTDDLKINLELNSKIVLKNRKGLNEVYLIKGNKKHPLITIN